MTKHTPAPLRKIIEKLPDNRTEILSCGHSFWRTLGLGETSWNPSKQKKRRCSHCLEIAQAEGK